MKRIYTLLLVVCSFSGFGQNRDTIGKATHVWVERGGTSFEKYLQAPLQPSYFTKVDSVGCLYYDTVLHELFVNNGSAWVPVAGDGSGTVTSISAGTGLSGGTITSAGTISLPNTGTAGTCGSATQIPVFVTDAQGRVTSNTNTAIGTLNQNTTGSAATLTTSRNIYGNAFNGSGDVTGSIGVTSTILKGSSSGTVTELPPATVTSYTWSPPSSVAASTGQVMQVYSISGTTALTQWATISGGGGTAGGSNTQIQYNNSGAFGGSSHLTLVSNVLTTDEDADINSITFGNGGGGSSSVVAGNGATGSGRSVGIGMDASPGYQGVAVGYLALAGSGASNSIAIGYQSGYNLGANSVCIGDALGTGAPSNSVIISDATGGCCSPIVFYANGNTHNVIIPSPGSFSLPSDDGNAFQVQGNISLVNAGNKLHIATGSNASVGTSSAMSSGTITISTSAVTASSIILLTGISAGAPPCATCGSLSVGTITAGTSFVINSSLNTDTRAVQWLIIN